MTRSSRYPTVTGAAPSRPTFRDRPRVVVAHVNVAPFVQQAARAFHEQGMLARMLTTVVDRPDAWWRRSLCRVAGVARFDLSDQFRRRAVTEVPRAFVRDRPWAELLRLGVGRADPSGVWADLAHEWMETGFSRWAGRTGLDDADAVYAYENSAAEVFGRAGDRGLVRIYDAPAPEHRFSQRIMEAEIGQDAALDTPYRRHIRRPFRERRRDARRQAEFAMADVIVTASTVTRDSFVEYFRAHGRESEAGKLVVVPYGAPPPEPDGLAGGSGGKGPVRLLWAGSFSVRKGARYLLTAWRRLSPKPAGAVLDVYGSVTVPRGLLEGLPESIRFHGPVGRDEILRAYLTADLLVFPTLCDGFGMVVTEALSRGVPVLTTTRAGAADLIRPTENGMLVDPADADALASALERALTERAALAAMRPAALRAAARWQWADYRGELARVVRQAVRWREPARDG